MLTLNSTTSPGFDDPLEMLHACHGKILQQCNTLKKLEAHLVKQGCDEAAQQAAHGILRYFDTAGRLHHQDEELDLFPSLRINATTSKMQIDRLLDRLISEHLRMMSAWESIRVTLLHLADGEYLPLPNSLIEEFINSHVSHIALEEAELLPLAAATLSTKQIEILGHSMAKRRITTNRTVK